METLLPCVNTGTTVTVPRSLRCLVLNRWDDDCASYHRYIDHTVHRVAYITRHNAVSRLRRDSAVCIEIVDNLDEQRSVFEAAQRCCATLGGIDLLIALSEFDLILAAELRAAFNIAGHKPDEIRRFRDKTVMKDMVAAAGLRVPAFARLDDPQALESLLDTKGFPLMVKPRAGAAAKGAIASTHVRL